MHLVLKQSLVVLFYISEHFGAVIVIEVVGVPINAELVNLLSGLHVILLIHCVAGVW